MGEKIYINRVKKVSKYADFRRLSNAYHTKEKGENRHRAFKAFDRFYKCSFRKQSTLWIKGT
jgi:hypothetical protein